MLYGLDKSFKPFTYFQLLLPIFASAADAVAFGSASSELQELTQAPRQQLKADNEAAAALGRKARKWSCKELREAIIATAPIFSVGFSN